MSDSTQFLTKEYLSTTWVTSSYCIYLDKSVVFNLMKHTYICIGVMENDIPVMCYGIVIKFERPHVSIVFSKMGIKGSNIFFLKNLFANIYQMI